MASYTIHLPPADANAVTDMERFRLVKDGLSPWAMVLWPVWFLFKRLWLAALGVVCLWAGVNGLLYWLGVPAGFVLVSWALLVFMIGLEANSVERWTLKRRGWQEVGVTIANDRREAEERVAVALAEQGQVPAPPASAPMVAAPVPILRAQAASASGVLGLFPEPRR